MDLAQFGLASYWRARKQKRHQRHRRVMAQFQRNLPDGAYEDIITDGWNPNPDGPQQKLAPLVLPQVNFFFYVNKAGLDIIGQYGLEDFQSRLAPLCNTISKKTKSCEKSIQALFQVLSQIRPSPTQRK